MKLQETSEYTLYNIVHQLKHNYFYSLEQKLLIVIERITVLVYPVPDFL